MGEWAPLNVFLFRISDGHSRMRAQCRLLQSGGWSMVAGHAGDPALRRINLAWSGCHDQANEQTRPS